MFWEKNLENLCVKFSDEDFFKIENIEFIF